MENDYKSLLLQQPQGSILTVDGANAAGAEAAIAAEEKLWALVWKEQGSAESTLAQVLQSDASYSAAFADKMALLHSAVRAAGSRMIANGGGRVLFLLHEPQGDDAGFALLKSAVSMYGRQLACEWAKYGITVNTVICENSKEAAEAYPCYLLSPAADFVTGQVLTV